MGLVRAGEKASEAPRTKGGLAYGSISKKSTEQAGREQRSDWKAGYRLRCEYQVQFPGGKKDLFQKRICDQERMLMCGKVANNNFDGQFHYSVQKKCRH